MVFAQFPQNLPLVRWSVVDYHHLVATGVLDDRPVELLNNQVVEMAPEGPEHVQLSTDAAEY